MNAPTPTTTQPRAASAGGAVRSAAGFLGRHAVALNLAGVVAVVGGLSAYIAQINGSVADGYRLRDLQDQVDVLTFQNAKLEVAARKARSFEELQKDVKMLGLVPGGTPAYVDATPTVAIAP